MRVSPHLLSRAREASGLSQRELAEKIAEWPGFEGKAPALKVRLSRLENGHVRSVAEQFGEALREELGLAGDRSALTGGERWAWCRRVTSGDYLHAVAVGMRYPVFGSPEQALDGRDVLAREAAGALADTELREVSRDEDLVDGDTYFDEFCGPRPGDDESYDDTAYPALWHRRLPALRLVDPLEDELHELGVWWRAMHDPRERARELALVALVDRVERDVLRVPPHPLEMLNLAKRRVRHGGWSGYAGQWEPASEEVLAEWRREADVLTNIARTCCSGVAGG